MGYDRSGKTYRGGPDQPDWEFAEDGPSANRAHTSGRAVLAKYDGGRHRSDAEKAAQPVTRWTSDEPSPVTLVVGVTHDQKKPPDSDDAILYAYGIDVTPPPPAPQGQRATGMIRMGGAYDGQIGHYMIGPVVGVDGSQLTLRAEGNAMIGGVLWLMASVTTPGENGNIPNGTIIPVTEYGAAVGITDGVVVGSYGSQSAGHAGVGLVRFDGDLINFNQSYPDLPAYGSISPFYIEDPDHGRVYLYRSDYSQLSPVPTGCYVGVEHKEVYLQLTTGTANEGAWTNFPAGTEVRALPPWSGVQGWVEVEIENQAQMDLILGASNMAQIKSLTSDQWAWNDFNIVPFVGKQITPAHDAEPARVRLYVTGYGASIQPPGPIMFRYAGESVVFGKVTVVAGEGPMAAGLYDATEPTYNSGMGAHTWTNGRVVGGAGSLVLASPAQDDSDAWQAGPGVTITDPSGFTLGTEPGFVPSGPGFEGGYLPGASSDGYRGPPAGVLKVTYGVGEVRRTLALDLRSGSYQLPPCSFVEVSAYLWGSHLWEPPVRYAENATPVVVAAALVPGDIAHPSLMLHSVRLTAVYDDSCRLLTPPGTVALRVLGGDEQWQLEFLRWNDERWGDPPGSNHWDQPRVVFNASDPTSNRCVPPYGMIDSWIPVTDTSVVKFVSANGLDWTIQFLIEP